MKSSWMKSVAAMATLVFTATTSNASVTEYEEIIYYHGDALGSPIAATDSNGDVLWREQYSPYGSRLLHESRETNCSSGTCIPVESSWDEKQWFTGKLEETRTGMQYFGARWYEPELGRFLSVDPVVFREDNVFSFNRYAYANNNPFKFIDPDGRDSISLTGTVHLPGSILHFLGLGEVPVSGIHGGIAASFPGPWTPDTKFAIGLIGGIDIPSVDLGLGKASVDIGYSKGSLSDLSSDSLELEATIGNYDVGVNWDAASGDISGVKVGVGFSLGRSSRTLNRVAGSVKNGALRNAVSHLIKNNLNLTYQKNSVVDLTNWRSSNNSQNKIKRDKE